MFSCGICEMFKNTFFSQKTSPRVAASIYVAFHECFFFTSPLPHFHYFLTVLFLSSFEETLSSLYHYYYIITILISEWFIRIAATATTYCTVISMIVTCISALIVFILERKKIRYEKSITEKYWPDRIRGILGNGAIREIFQLPHYHLRLVILGLDKFL